MESKKVALVIVDISGYTQFIRSQRLSAVHAEEIIFELLEAVIDHVAYPLILNKLEGDAALLYAEVTDDPPTVAQDVARQAQAFFDVFYARARSLSQERANCDCNACQSVHELRLKAILHSGDVIFKKIRQFEEMAGEDVILIHQLLKNSIPSNEYIVMTQPFYELVGELDDLSPEMRQETCDSLGEVTILVFYPRLNHRLELS